MKEVSVIKLLLEAWVEILFMVGLLFVDLLTLFFDLISIKTNLL